MKERTQFHPKLRTDHPAAGGEPPSWPQNQMVARAGAWSDQERELGQHAATNWFTRTRAR
jgi:hypothetical protein